MQRYTAIIGLEIELLGLVCVLVLCTCCSQCEESWARALPASVGLIFLLPWLWQLHHTSPAFSPFSP